MSVSLFSLSFSESVHIVTIIFFALFNKILIILYSCFVKPANSSKIIVVPSNKLDFTNFSANIVNISFSSI